MEQLGVCRGLLFQYFDVIFIDLILYFFSDECGKYDYKGGVEFVLEYGYGKVGFGDGELVLFVELFDFGWLQGVEVEVLEVIYKRFIDNKYQICENLNGLLLDEF